VTTEDEVMCLLRRADPDRGRADVPSVDGTDYLAALRTRSTTVTLIDPEPIPPQPEGHHWPIIAVAAAAVVAIGVGGLVIATRNDDPTGGVAADQPTTVAQPTTTAAQPTTVAQPPAEFTACIRPGPEVHSGTTEEVVVPLSDGEMTIQQTRGFTYRQSLTEVSDPRLEGTLYQAFDSDEYTVRGNEPDPSTGDLFTDSVPMVATFTNRIENEEGAWQGSVVMLVFPDDTESVQMVMVGEGAYEGMTAIVAFDPFSFEGSCTVKGYIIEGSVPAPPVPQTGQ
jgi:hypothetical protein